MTRKLKFLSVASFAIGLAALVNFGNANAAGAACVDYMYRQGSVSTCVRYIQTLNNVYANMGYANTLSVDAVFGWRTDASIRKLQDKFALQPDGIVGPKTWGLLCTVQAGWTDEYGRNHMYVPPGWPLETAKAAGCSKYWKGAIVNGVQY